MRQKSVNQKPSSERIVKDIRRATRKQYSAEEKIRIVLDGLRGEHSIAELCRREGIAESLYYNAGVVAAGTGHALHRRGKLLCLGSVGLSLAQGTRPDHQLPSSW